MAESTRFQDGLEPGVLPASKGLELLELIASQLAVADLTIRPASPPPAPDRTYYTSESLWADILGQRLWVTAVVRLEDFWLSEWLPLRPGLFHTNEASMHRRYAQRFTLAGAGADEQAVEAFEREVGHRIPSETLRRLRRDVVHVYLPEGKVSMLKGGVGCVRLKNKRVEGDTVWFLGASSTVVAHEGVVVALSDEDYARVIAEIHRLGALRCSLTGRVALVPPEFDALYRELVGIPQLYLRVEKLEVAQEQPNEEFLATGAVMVRSDRVTADDGPHHVWDLARGLGAAYVTFAAGRPSSLAAATEWLALTYARDVMDGVVVTDFDEHVRHFRDAAFGLEQVLGGRVRADDAIDVLDRCGAPERWRTLVIEKLEINGGLAVGGDQYNVGQAGAVGPGARAHDMTFVYSNTAIDTAALGDELARLRAYLRAQAETPEQDAALGVVAHAELKAKEGDADGAIEQLSAFRRLGDAGRWVLEAATTIGTTVAAAALKGALGV